MRSAFLQLSGENFFAVHGVEVNLCFFLEDFENYSVASFEDPAGCLRDYWAFF